MQKKLLTKFNIHLRLKKKKNSPESGHKGNISQHNKNHRVGHNLTTEQQCDKPKANTTLNGEKQKVSSL